MGRLIDADICLHKAWQNFYKQEDEHKKNIDGYDIMRDQFYEQSGFECCQQTIVNAPTVEAIPKDQYETRLKAEREKIAEDVADKMDYMGSCLNEKNIILGIITGKRETLDSLCSTCKSESCVSNGTAIPKADYENRLKADLVAMLTDFLMDIEENTSINATNSEERNGKRLMRTEIIGMFEQKINSLKENENG